LDLALKPWHPNIAVRGRMARKARRAGRIRGGICLIKGDLERLAFIKARLRLDDLVCLSR
jgi:hypothetical protein